MQISIYDFLATLKYGEEAEVVELLSCYRDDEIEFLDFFDVIDVMEVH